MKNDCTKILLVEDSDDEAFLLSLVIGKESRAQVVTHVRNGEETVAYLSATGLYNNREAHPYPDLMLLDLNMPRMNGFEVLEWLRTQSHRPEVVVFTSSQRQSDRDRCFELGADDFIVKPVELADLKEVVSNLVNRAYQRQRAESGARLSA